MRKIDLSVSQEQNAIGSRSAVKADLAKAQQALEKAKLLNRKVVYTKSGDDEFSRELKAGITSDMIGSRSAARHIGIAYSAFCRRITKLGIPSFKNKIGDKFYRISDLDNNKERFFNC
ncbi:hypothetical protein FY557_17310 [Chryseobacterium sp. SN22]|uniref:hypothetical protein n=1 Tax=Chryseobacterium sp. SN22 TaxID=2606431 RepID=UPI0011EBA68E|nr:hypothetical protein [Chryseobacterium sp. SN22]KAA0126409.1 hypothetical protein FY557_17310 [Chryseobacterium sp. SN22]